MQIQTHMYTHSVNIHTRRCKNIHIYIYTHTFTVVHPSSTVCVCVCNQVFSSTKICVTKKNDTLFFPEVS